MVQQNGRAERDGTKVALQFAFVGVWACYLFHRQYAPELDNEASAAFFVGIGDHSRSDLTGMNAGVPAVTAARAVGELFCRERDPARLGRHTDLACLGGADGSNAARSVLAAGKAECAQASEQLQSLNGLTFIRT